MINLYLCSSATVRHLLSTFVYMYFYYIHYVSFNPCCCKWSSFGCIEAMKCGCPRHGPHRDSVYSGSEPNQLHSSWLVTRTVGFSSPRRTLIGSNQIWRADDSPHYREYIDYGESLITKLLFINGKILVTLAHKSQIRFRFHENVFQSIR